MNSQEDPQDTIKKLLARIQRLEEQLELRDMILDQLPASVYVKDEQSRHIYANREDLIIKGVDSREEVIGKTDEAFFPDQSNELMQNERHVIGTGEPLIDKEETFVDKTNNVRVLSTTKLPWIDKSGQPRGIIGIGHNITWHKQEQDILNDINRRIVSADNVKTIIRAIVKGAMRLSKATSGIIFLIDGQEGDYKITDYYHYPHEAHHPPPRLETGVGVTHDVIKYGVPVYIPDTLVDPRPNPALENVRTLLALPLQQGDRIIGVFFVNDSEPNRFSAHDIRHLSTMADYAVVALEKMRLFTNTREAQRQIVELHEASTALMAPTHAQDILTTMARIGLKTTDADWVTIVLIDKHRRITDLIYYPDDSRFNLENIRPRPNGNSLAVFNSGIFYYVEDIEKEPKRVNPLTRAQGFKSVIGLPLTMENDQQIGVLWLHYLTKRRFLPEQIASYELFARQGAMAYHNALSISKIKEKEQITRAITNLIPLGDKNATLQRIVDSVPLVVDCQSVTLFVYNEDRDELENPPTIYGTKYPEETRRVPIIYRHSIVYKMLELDKCYILEDVSTDDRFKNLPFVKRENVKSCLTFPLIAAGKKAGVMFINYDQPQVFTDDELTHLQTFVDQAAVAVQNAQLLDKLTENASAFEQLNKISLNIAHSQSIDDILSTIATSAVNLTRATDSMIYLFDYKAGQYEITRRYGSAQYPAPDFNHKSSMGRQAIDIRQPIILNGIQSNHEQAKEHPQLHSMGVEAAIALPLTSNDQVLGVLYVYHRDYHRFTKHDEMILTTLSNDAAIAIANEQQRRERIGVVDDIARTIAAENNQDHVLKHILNSIQHLIPDLVYGDIRLLNEHKTHLRVAASVGEAAPEPEGGVEIIYGITGSVARSREWRYVPDVRKATDYRLVSDRTRSELVVPLIDGDEKTGVLLGVLNLEHPELDGLNPTEIQLIIAIAKLAVVAYQNVQRYQALEEKRRAEINAITQMGRSIAATSQGAHETLQAILSWIAGLTTVASMYPCLIEIMSFKEYGQQLNLVEGWSEGKPHPSSVPIEMRGIFADAIQNKQVLIAHDVKAAPEYTQPRCDDACSQMVIPLIKDDRLEGLLNIGHPHVNAFDNSFIELGGVIGQLLMVAIKHAERYEELKKQKGQIDARTTIMWMSLASGIWYHEVRGEAATIFNQVTLARRDIYNQKYSELGRRFDRISLRARHILDKKELIPINPATELFRQPLRPFITNSLERICQAVAKPHHTFHPPTFGIDDTLEVEINTEWLEKVLEILINNGIDAMRNYTVQEMRFAVSIEGDYVTIAITDTGRGILPEIINTLNLEILPPYDPGKKGMGIGLLMAQTIMHIFGGFLKADAAYTPGTKMVIYLPFL